MFVCIIWMYTYVRDSFCEIMRWPETFIKICQWTISYFCQKLEEMLLFFIFWFSLTAVLAIFHLLLNCFTIHYPYEHAFKKLHWKNRIVTRWFLGLNRGIVPSRCKNIRTHWVRELRNAIRLKCCTRMKSLFLFSKAKNSNKYWSTKAFIALYNETPTSYWSTFFSRPRNNFKIKGEKSMFSYELQRRKRNKSRRGKLFAGKRENYKCHIAVWT